MNAPARIAKLPSVCPHDCPSACALEVEVVDGRSIGRVYGAKEQAYTAGVICAKVARYAERIHHPDRLLHPMKRVGPKGSGRFERIAWDEALDTIAARFIAAERDFGAESVWPEAAATPGNASVAPQTPATDETCTGLLETIKKLCGKVGA